MDSIRKIPEQHRQLLLMSGVDEIIDKVKLTDRAFDAFKYTSYDKIKVVIIGEAPYSSGATGLAFSTGPTGRIKGSLRNIYKCLLEHGLISRMPTHGDLTSWAEQGVLLLNIALTRDKQKSWDPITGNYLKLLLEQKSNIVVMLWGKRAAEILKCVDAKTRSCHLILTWGHPSPAAKNNQCQGRNNFVNCDNFTRANKYLMRKTGKSVNWDSVNFE